MFLRDILVPIGFSLFLAGPLQAQSFDGFPCNQISVEVFPRTAHLRGFSGDFGVKSNGLVISCGFVFPVSHSFSVVTGFSAMSFVNSFDVQSYSFGASLEVQFRPEELGNIRFYAGIDGGFIYGYEGYFAEDRMIGPVTAAGTLKGGLLFDIPENQITVFGGVRVVPPVFGHSGIIAPSIGLTYTF